MPEVEQEDGDEAASCKEHKQDGTLRRCQVLDAAPHGDEREHTDDRGEDVAPDDKGTAGVLEGNIGVGTAHKNQ